MAGGSPLDLYVRNVCMCVCQMKKIWRWATVFGVTCRVKQPNICEDIEINLKSDTNFMFGRRMSTVNSKVKNKCKTKVY
jgi:hypothetical protein